MLNPVYIFSSSLFFYLHFLNFLSFISHFPFLNTNSLHHYSLLPTSLFLIPHSILSPLFPTSSLLPLFPSSILLFPFFHIAYSLLLIPYSLPLIPSFLCILIPVFLLFAGNVYYSLPLVFKVIIPAYSCYILSLCLFLLLNLCSGPFLLCFSSLFFVLLCLKLI